MTDYELLDLFGRAFACDEADNLRAFLAPDCEYGSDYSGRKLKTAEKIIESMKAVDACLNENNQYSYDVIKLDDVLRGIKHEELSHDGLNINEYGLLLYQFKARRLVAVVVVSLDENGLINSIMLSRNSSWFNVDFLPIDLGDDSPDDLPSTVQTMTSHDRQVKELRNAFSGQHLDDSPEEITGDVYIWKKADEFIMPWLGNQGYTVLESQAFDDCVGYRCNRKNYAYTVFMYAFGKEQTVQLDGEYCKKLTELEFSKDSIVLVVYLKVKRYKPGNEIVYKVCNYTGDEELEPEMWCVTEVNGKPILEYFPHKEMIEAVFRLMYAFNHNSIDAYDCIICESNPSIKAIDHSGPFLNSAFYRSLRDLREQYGVMKYGFVRYNDVLYSLTPYLDGYGFFGFSVNNADRIIEITPYPFDGGERKVAEYIKIGEREGDDWFSDYPTLTDVEALPPVETERFALKLTFDNGEIKKYILPVSREDEKDEAVSYLSHVFTDKIWQSAYVCKDGKSFGFAKRVPGVSFKNEFFISGYLCYQESEDYSEPVLCNETVFENDALRLERLWTWKVNSVYEDKETGILKVLLSGQAFNGYGVSTFASREGKRLSSVNFDYIDSFSEGMAIVGKNGEGLGFVDRDMRFVVPMVYERADDFKNGRAEVKRNGEWIFIDKDGREIKPVSESLISKYQELGEYHEGMCKVSTLKLRFMDLAYHSDYEDIAGVWGFVDESGQEVIAPQYIYAVDFFRGIAIVCKGKWTIDKKWDNKYNTGHYWTEEELWGAIDKSGNTVIPFIFDEIMSIGEENEAFAVHYGGWEEGKWGVVDRRGNWLAEPVFKDIGYDYRDGLVTFYDEDKCEDDSLLGIYDTKQKKIIFEPQFRDVIFNDDGWIEVEVFDKELGRWIKKLIDREGNEKFHSVYTSIYTWKKPCEVVIRDENGYRKGLIDENGNVILPCEYKVPYNGIYYEQKRIVFEEDDKCGVMDFDGNIIIPPVYKKVYGVDKPLLTVGIGENERTKEGLITPEGEVVVPPEYENIRLLSDGYIICCRYGQCEMLLLMAKES